MIKMTKDNNKYPSEGGLMLYRGLIQAGSISHKHQSMRNKRERKRVLDILSLLPEQKEIPTEIINLRNKSAPKRDPISTSKAKSFSHVPYLPRQLRPKSGHPQTRKDKMKHRDATERSTKFGQRSRVSEDYIWHPVHITKKNRVKESVVTVHDVMKHYRSRFHLSG